MKFIEPFKVLCKNRKMIKQTTFNDIKARYAGSFLGLTWTVLYPLIFLGTYALVYMYIFKSRYGDFNTYEYVILIFCGLVPFIGFQESIMNGISCVTTNVGLMKNTLFPIELVPVKTILASQTTQVSGMIMILIAIIFTNKFSIYAPFFIVCWIFQMMFQLGVVWILSSLDVIFRDLRNIINVVIILLMMISPIAYSVYGIPENFKPFLKLNPLYYIISAYQSVFIYGRLPDRGTFIVFMIMSLTFLSLVTIFLLK